MATLAVVIFFFFCSLLQITQTLYLKQASEVQKTNAMCEFHPMATTETLDFQHWSATVYVLTRLFGRDETLPALPACGTIKRLPQWHSREGGGTW